MAKTAATGAYHVEFDGHETEQALAVKFYGAAEGVRPSEPHLARLVKIVVRIAQRQTQKLREHRNAHEGDDEYVPPTAAEEDAWRNDDAAMKDSMENAIQAISETSWVRDGEEQPNTLDLRLCSFKVHMATRSPEGWTEMQCAFGRALSERC